MDEKLKRLSSIISTIGKVWRKKPPATKEEDLTEMEKQESVPQISELWPKWWEAD